MVFEHTEFCPWRTTTWTAPVMALLGYARRHTGTTRRRSTRTRPWSRRSARAVLPLSAGPVRSLIAGRRQRQRRVVTPDGYLLTSAQCRSPCARARKAAFAPTAPHRRGRGRSRDVLSDLAVLKARTAVPAPVAMGRAEDLRVGQLVVAVGNPSAWPVAPPRIVQVGDMDGSPTRAAGESMRSSRSTPAVEPRQGGGARPRTGPDAVGVSTAVAESAGTRSQSTTPHTGSSRRYIKQPDGTPGVAPRHRR